MRTATIVIVVYFVLLVLGAIWWRFETIADARPEVAGLAAAYLGLTARRSIAGAVGASIIIGYLADLLGGDPKGMYALIAGILCLVAHLVQTRVLVRGLGVTLGFAFFVGMSASLLVIIIEALNGHPLARITTELWWMLTSGVATALVGPLLLRLLRRIDAAFARTYREKDAALEGLVP
jgi:rod shape-determining protein MreD